MRLILPYLLLILMASFTLTSPKKKNKYQLTYIDQTLVYLPSSTFDYREADPLKIGNEFVKTEVTSLNSFYISPYEVSNFQYTEFLFDSKKTQSDSIYKSLLPDTLVWREKLSFCEPYVDYYFRHSAYRNYPVVGITYKQCELYCEWLTEKYNSIEKRKYKKVKFRLPTKKEWYAATQMISTDKKTKKNEKLDISNRYKTFPWSGPYLRNKNNQYLANFKLIDESTFHRQIDTLTDSENRKEIQVRYIARPDKYMGMAGHLNDFADVTAPINSYWPNEAGIYCLAGNVEEFVAEYGVTKGGSWRDPGYYLRNEVVEVYDSTNEVSSEKGFRYVMEVVEE